MLKLTFIADTHHYSETLGTEGRQYALRSGSDQKYLAETGAIIDAAISRFTTHIGTCSYVVQLNDNVRLFALNDDKNEHNHAGFTEAHFCWIEEQLQISKGQCDNRG